MGGGKCKKYWKNKTNTCLIKSNSNLNDLNMSITFMVFISRQYWFQFVHNYVCMVWNCWFWFYPHLFIYLAIFILFSVFVRDNTPNRFCIVEFNKFDSKKNIASHNIVRVWMYVMELLIMVISLVIHKVLKVAILQKKCITA